MWFGLLGSLEVLDDDGTPVELGGPQPRRVLASLLLAEGRPVSLDALIDVIWSGRPPASAAGTVQSYVSRLRKSLGTDRLTLDDVGYRLIVDPDQVDHLRFERLADLGRAQLDAGNWEEARTTLLEADGLWRGAALAEFTDLDPAIATITRLDERRITSTEDRIDADLALGRESALVSELAMLVESHPLRERLQAQLAIALYRSGRQAEALRSLANAGRMLRDELGIEPSRQLRELESAILAHDPALEPARTSAPQSAADIQSSSVSMTTARPPLVGRDDELAELTAAYAEARDDVRFVVVEGEPGIGKTRLVEEFRLMAVAQGALAVWGRSDEGGAAPALWPWLTPLRAVAASGVEVPEAVAELLAGEVTMATGQAQAAQFERFEAVARVLDAAAAIQPMVLLLDDLQWADATSLELLAMLGGRLGPGILVVVTVRQLEVGRRDAVIETLGTIARRSGSRRVVLRGLGETETAEVLGDVARALTPERASAIHARAEGNPFYAIELARLFDEDGNADEVPGSVGDVVRVRLSRLPAATTELLGVAAVTGRDVDLHVLAAAAGLDISDALDRLEPAVVHRLLVDVPDRPGALRFSHALVREVLLEDLSSVRRARLHLQVADAMEARGTGVDDAEILAEHLWRAAPVGVGARAAGALERAADVAVRRVAYAAAEDMLERAVQLRRASASSTDDHLAELHSILRLLEVARARRYFQGATSPAVLERAKELAASTDQHDRLLELLWFEWSSMATSARIMEAAPLAERFRSLSLSDPRPEVQANGYEVMGVEAWGSGHIAEAVEHLDRAMELLERSAPPTDGFALEQMLVSRTFWLFNHAMQGSFTADKAFGEFDEMLAGSPDRFATASICGFAATTALALGEWDRADRYATLSREIDPDAQFAFWNGQSLMQWGVVQARRGEISRGVVAFEEGRETYMAIGGRSALPTFEASLAICLAIHQDHDLAQRFAEDARRHLDTIGERWNEPVVLIGEGTVAIAGGDLDAARERFERAADVACAQGADQLAERARKIATNRL